MAEVIYKAFAVVAVVARRRGPLTLERCFCSAVGVACRGCGDDVGGHWETQWIPSAQGRGVLSWAEAETIQTAPVRTVAKAEVIYKACAVVEVVAAGGGP